MDGPQYRLPRSFILPPRLVLRYVTKAKLPFVWKRTTDNVEGVNGRLPNQDVFNTIAHVARYSVGVQTRVHDIDSEPDWQYPQMVKEYLLAAKHLVHHFYYNALGKPSGAHGVLARYVTPSRLEHLTPFGWADWQTPYRLDDRLL